jgi:hypothetical protein
MSFVEGAGWLLFLVIRAVALWVLIPLASLAWLVAHVWLQRASIAQAVCWYDRNFSAAVAKGMALPFADNGKRVEFARLSQMTELPTYRIRWLTETV